MKLLKLLPGLIEAPIVGVDQTAIKLCIRPASDQGGVDSCQNQGTVHFAGRHTYYHCTSPLRASGMLLTQKYLRNEEAIVYFRGERDDPCSLAEARDVMELMNSLTGTC